MFAVFCLILAVLAAPFKSKSRAASFVIAECQKSVLTGRTWNTATIRTSPA